ncbi:MAG: hypothetical protein IH591_14675 [Bacteroidales bacterium]|nr:hypothetical protein [Bacteroidales bacterium]
MKQTLYITLILLLTSITINAQTTTQPAPATIKFSGFVRNDIFFNTRQTVAAREGAFLLWPEKINYDMLGEDINARSDFNIMAIITRMTVSVTGPEALGAKTSALIETDFFGQANDNISLIRLRHALIKFNWNRLELMIGQYWNPLFVVGNTPSTVSFNAGTPFNSFARNPQLRLTASLGHFTLIGAALSQRDHSSYASPGAGTAATASPAYLRNSLMPDMHLQLHLENSNESNVRIGIGAGGAYKRIVPRLTARILPPAANMVVVDEHVDGFTGIIFGRLISKSISLRMYARYGENISDLLAPGGYAALTPANPLNPELNYVPLRSKSYWLDFGTNGKKFQAGVFTGYFINKGSGKTVIDPDLIFGRATDISSLFRVSPRLVFISGKVSISAEVEYMKANFGLATFSDNALPLNVRPVENVRIVSTVVYNF